MRRSRLCSAVLVGLAAALVAACAVGAENPPPTPQGLPPTPVSADGALVSVLARGVPTPTAFAFGGGHVFVVGAGSEGPGPSGGVFVLRAGQAMRIPGLPFGFGLAWRNGTLYESTYPTGILAFSGWNGTTFTQRRVVFTGPKRFSGVNGIAFGWDGRLYAGVGLTSAGDHNRSFRPYANSVISMGFKGGNVRVVAKGLRQPWQPVFAKGIAAPFVTVLGQENLGRNQPPDYVVKARGGLDFGFARCNWSVPAACAGFAKPVQLFPAHSSPTGIAAIGHRLYIGFFGGLPGGVGVASIPTGGGQMKPVLRGFVAPVVAVGASHGYLYVGDLTGSIYRVKA